jgi:hypothetical protein
MTVRMGGYDALSDHNLPSIHQNDLDKYLEQVPIIEEVQYDHKSRYTAGMGTPLYGYGSAIRISVTSAGLQSYRLSPWTPKSTQKRPFPRFS